tara:strand:- start:158 stop:397 length:240 start_codon:yes stop_codon:yes gene_type:complete
MIDAANGDTARVEALVWLLNGYALAGLALVLTTVATWSGRGWGRGSGAVVSGVNASIVALGAVCTWPGLLLFQLLGPPV